MTEQNPPPERPRVEPEILPPDRNPEPSAWREREFTDVGGTHRIHVTRLGPVGGILLMLVIALLVAVMLLTLLGAFLIALPVAAFIVLAGAFFGLLRMRR